LYALKQAINVVRERIIRVGATAGANPTTDGDPVAKDQVSSKPGITD